MSSPRPPAEGLQSAYDRLQERLGQVTRVRLSTVRAADFRRFAVACDHLDPVVMDDAAAVAAGLPSSVAPPSFVSSVMGWGEGPPSGELRPDGTGGDPLSGLPVEGLRLVGAGQQVEIHGPVVDGTELHLEITLEEVQLKQGRSGELVLLKIRKRFLDGHDRQLVVCDETFIGR